MRIYVARITIELSMSLVAEPNGIESTRTTAKHTYSTPIVCYLLVHKEKNGIDQIV